MQFDQLIAPVGDLADEEIRSRVHGLDRDRRVRRRAPSARTVRPASHRTRSDRGPRSYVRARTSMPRRRRRRAAIRLSAGFRRGAAALPRVLGRTRPCCYHRDVFDPWQILRDGGLPLAMPSSGAAPADEELAAVARQVIASAPAGRDADALAAWLLAWHGHWPSSFRRCFGSDEATVIAWARSHACPADRYIKLRRIALENLASLLMSRTVR